MKHPNPSTPASYQGASVSKTHISVFPPLIPGEIVWGYQARVRLINRAGRLNTVHQLRGASTADDTNSASLLPAGLPSLVDQVPHMARSVDQLLRYNTIMPMLNWCMNIEAAGRIVQKAYLGEQQQIQIQELGQGTKYPRHCPECATYDRQHYGVPIWRRLALLSFMTICPRHGIPLLAGCGVCSRTDALLSDWPLPSPTCACGLPQKPFKEEELAPHRGLMVRIASVSQGMLTRDVPQSVRSNASFVFDSALRAMDPGGRTGSASIPRFLRSLHEDGTMDALTILNARATSRAVFYQARRSEDSPNLLARVLMIQGLFGTLSNFEQLCSEYTPSGLVAPKKQPTRATLDGMCQRVLNLLQADPTLTRARAMERLPRQMSALNRWDNAWLNSMLPALPRAVEVQSPSLLKKAATRDQRESKSILARSKVIRTREGRPVRVTKKALASDLRNGGDKGIGPLALKALAESVESIDQFRVRCIQWAIDHISEIGSRTNLVRYIVARLSGMDRYTRANALLARRIPIGIDDVRDPTDHQRLECDSKNEE